MTKGLYDENGNIPKCLECGSNFSNVFEAVEHYLEDDEEFDPALVLPGGYRLMIGSLLRSLYDNKDKPDHIAEMTQSTYAALFAVEMDPEIISETIEDIIVESEMEDFDAELKKLYKNGE